MARETEVIWVVTRGPITLSRQLKAPSSSAFQIGFKSKIPCYYWKHARGAFDEVPPCLVIACATIWCPCDMQPLQPASSPKQQPNQPVIKIENTSCLDLQRWPLLLLRLFPKFPVDSLKLSQKRCKGEGTPLRMFFQTPQGA